MTKKSYSFKKGFSQVPVGKTKEVKDQIMRCLKITSHPAWLRRLRGEIEPRISEMDAVYSVFLAHGIEDIWGE